MKTVLAAAALMSLAVITAPSANAAGCVSGAVVGGVAGHVAGHHGLLGAAGGCAIGHHMAHRRDVRARQAQQQMDNSRQ